MIGHKEAPKDTKMEPEKESIALGSMCRDLQFRMFSPHNSPTLISPFCAFSCLFVAQQSLGIWPQKGTKRESGNESISPEFYVP